MLNEFSANIKPKYNEQHAKKLAIKKSTTIAIGILNNVLRTKAHLRIINVVTTVILSNKILEIIMFKFRGILASVTKICPKNKAKMVKAALIAYSGRFRPGIPTEAGHPFRRKAATYSDVKPATFWVASEWVAGIKRNKNFI